MKKLIGALAVLIMTTTSTANAAEPIKILVKNEQIKTDAAPIVEQGRVLVPLRAVAESLGATVDWDSKTKTATVRKWSESVRLTVGKNTALVEKANPLSFSDLSGAVPLDVSVKSANNRVYVPLRFVSQQFGYQVNWGNNTVFINSPLSDSDRKTMYEGDLTASRKLVMKLSAADVHYQHKPLDVMIETEDFTRTFLFAEGEALRFYYIFGNSVSLIEFKDDFPVVTWQAHIQAGAPLQRLFEGNFTDQQGTAPTINKTFLYYSTGMFGDGNEEACGRIDPNGKITEIGYQRTVGGDVIQRGVITLELHDEKRADESVE